MDSQKRIITEIINHPQYYSGGLFNDLAILRWHEPLRINDRVDNVDLPSDYTVHFDNCTLVSFEVSANQFGKKVEYLIFSLYDPLIVIALRTYPSEREGTAAQQRRL